MKLVPFYECAVSANEQVENGATIYQKFWCENCKAAQHIENPNAFYLLGKCEKCNHITNLEMVGCNYMLVVEGSKALSYLEKQIKNNVQEV